MPLLLPSSHLLLSSPWKPAQLSLAGRLILVKSVIQVIPIYRMMSMAIPKSILLEIEKVQRAFIWGDTQDKCRVHVIDWRTMSLPKVNGGAAMCNLRKTNTACLMKLGCAIRVDSRSVG